MELEEMKNAWADVSQRVEKQEALLNSTLQQITQQNYRSKVNKIRYAEAVGTFICYGGAAYVSVNFINIENSLLQVAAALSMGLLLLLPIVSLKSVRAIKEADLSSITYLAAINDFARRKIRFQKLQKLNVMLALVLMLVGLPVLAAIQGKSLGQIPYFLPLVYPVFILFSLAFAYRVLKQYDRLLQDTETMLSEINQA